MIMRKEVLVQEDDHSMDEDEETEMEKIVKKKEMELDRVKFMFGLLLESTDSALRFIHILAEDKPHINRLFESLIEFSNKKSKLEKFWQTEKETFVKSAELLERYGMFQKQILQNAREGEKYIREGKGLAEKNSGNDLNIEESSIKQIMDRIPASKDPIMLVKFESNDMIVELCNQAFCTLIKFKKSEVVDKSKNG